MASNHFKPDQARAANGQWRTENGSRPSILPDVGSGDTDLDSHDGVGYDLTPPCAQDYSYREQLIAKHLTYEAGLDHPCAVSDLKRITNRRSLQTALDSISEGNVSEDDAEWLSRCSPLDGDTALVRAAAVRSGRLSDERVEEMSWDIGDASMDDRQCVRVAALQSGQLSPERCLHESRDEDWQIRAASISSHALPNERLNDMLWDDNNNVRDAAAAELQDRGRFEW